MADYFFSEPPNILPFEGTGIGYKSIKSTQMHVSSVQTILHCSHSMLIQKKDEKNAHYLDS